MWSPDLLVVRLREEPKPRASEGALPPVGPSTLKLMPMVAQSAGTALRARRRRLGRPSPNTSIASDAESDVVNLSLLTYWSMGFLFLPGLSVDWGR